MALGKDFRNLKGDFEKLNQESVQFQSDLVDIEKTIRQVAKGSKDFESAMGNAAATVKQSQKFAEDLTKASTENLKSQKEIDKIKRKQAKLLGVEQSINARINSLLALRVKQGSQEETNIKNVVKRLYDAQERLEKINDGYSGILDKSDKIAKSNPFKGLADLVSDIPVINKLLGNLVSASDKYRNTIIETNDSFEALLAGSTEYFKLLAKTIAIFSIKILKDGIVGIDKSSKALAANLGISNQNARNLNRSFQDQAKSLQGMFMTFVKIREAQIILTELSGVQNTFSAETAGTFSILTKNLGISDAISSKLNSTSILVGSNLKDQVESTIGLVRFNNQRFNIAVSEKVVMQEIANISSNVAMSMAAQGKNLASAVYQAQKLGLSMQQIEKTASSLLEFESSITNELEAELLIGKDLNLERARLAALNNDIQRVTEEIGKQGITQSSFSRMNAIQQSSIAKALGMTAAGMGDMFAKQATFKRLGAQDIGGVQEIIQQMRKDGFSRKQIQDKIGNDALLEAANNRTMQEQMQDLIDTISGKFIDLMLSILQKLKSLLDFFTGGDGPNRAMKGALQATALGSVGAVSTAGRIAKSTAGMIGLTGLMSKSAGASASAAGSAFQTGRFASGPRAGQQFFKVGGKFASESSFRAAQAASRTGSTAVKTASNVGRFAKFGGTAMKGLGRIAAPLAIAGVGFDAYQNFNDKSLSGGDAALKTLDQNKGLAAGTAAGLALAPLTGGISMLAGPLIGGVIDMFAGTFGDYGDKNLEEQKKTNELLLANNQQLMAQTQELYEAIARARSVSIDGDLLTSNSGINNTGGGRNIP
jgi:hypothetical protein